MISSPLMPNSSYILLSASVNETPSALHRDLKSVSPRPVPTTSSIASHIRMKLSSFILQKIKFPHLPRKTGIGAKVPAYIGKTKDFSSKCQKIQGFFLFFIITDPKPPDFLVFRRIFLFNDR